MAIEVADAVLDVFCRAYAATASVTHSCREAQISKAEGERLLASALVKMRIREIIRIRLAALECDHRYGLAKLKAVIDATVAEGRFNEALQALKLLFSLTALDAPMKVVEPATSFKQMVARTPEDDE